MKKLWIAITAVSIIAFSGVALAVRPDAPKSQPQPVQVRLYTPDELLAEANRLRAEKGVAPLKLDERLNQSAILKAEDLKTGHSIEHVNPTTGKRGVTYIKDIVGQGVCVYYNENLNDGGIQHSPFTAGGWPDSTPHYNELINPRYDITGFAAIQDGDRTIYVQHFCDLR